MPAQPKLQVEKPTAFKHWINADVLKRMADSIETTYPSFNRKAFLSAAKELEPLELKQRVRLVREHLKAHLPESFPKAVKILLKSLDAKLIDGFELWPYTDFVQTYGLDHFDESMAAIYKLTQLFTGEFAVRPFLKRYPKETLSLFEKWAKDKNVHVRRLSSEGSRPNLPWGERVREISQDPEATLTILETLKYDPELYVRKTVANHLNDLSHKHAKLVLNTLKTWGKTVPEGHEKEFNWMKARALRTLIKKGDLGALSLLGISSQTQFQVPLLKLQADRIKLGETLTFSFDLKSQAKKEQSVLVNYIIGHVNSRGELSPKVFRLRTFQVPAGETITVKKNHSVKPITTRRYYSGKHTLEIQINGQVVAKTHWHLQMPKS